MAVQLRLKVFKGEELVATRDFERDMIKIGRLATAHLCIDDDKVSRIHSVLNVEGDGKLSVVDMGSIEGTYLNGKRINKGSVAFGDELRIGNTRILIEKGGAESPTEKTNVVALPSQNDIVTTQAPLPNLAAPELQTAAAPPPPPAAAVAASAVQAPAPEVTHPGVDVATGSETVELPADEHLEGGMIVEGRYRKFKLKKRAFESYQPHAPVARRPDAEAQKLGLQIRYLWGDSLLQVSQFETPEKVVIGSAAGADLKLEAEQFDGSFELVTPAGEGWQLNLGPGMKGELDRDGSVKALSSGSHDLRAPDFAWVTLAGNLRAELSFAAQPKKVVVPISESIDYRFLNMFLVLALVTGAFVISARNFEEADVVADDLSMSRLSVAKVMFKDAEKPKKNLLLEKLEAQKKETQSGEKAEKHAGDEGKMGKKDAQESKSNRSAPKAIKIDAKELVKNSGLIKTLGGGGGGLSTIFGQGGLGGDIKGAIGNMFGSQVGDAKGLGGLGLKGTGTGGGGLGQTIGIGGIGTKGRGGGLGSYGTGVGGLGGKKSSDIGISDSEASVSGELDKELIRQVIRRNIGQIRYCYEKELQVKPNLGGKLAVRFIIAPNGDVSTAKIAEGSTLTDPAVSECVTVRVKGWKFPTPKGGGSVVVTYPFVLKASGD